MFEFHDLIGLVGAVLVLVAYMMLQMDRMSSSSLIYSVLNFVGGLMIMFSLTNAWNFSAVFIEIAWIAISFYGIYRCYKNKRAY